jgi:hypothetical protein
MKDILADYRDMLIGGGVLLALVLAGNVSHIVERQLIHFFSAAGVYLLVYLLLDSIGRRTGVTWITRRVEPPALIAMIFIWFGEPDDILTDGATKSYIDMSVWATGFVISIIALRRWCKSRAEEGKER